ncbi:hypothetical protein [Nocardiopsis sp. L17-MgMaSL7]|uniref:hypothetical protein n=1 Tax=Nocardiopsis sp. L17-MgMaSL7 TaxID=1938893 RepID=UPI000D717AB4|nr:hypothetical protein [Nocardiopsis sp. L17-MgMaSL7]PWV58141.1 hypothetical protein BDW27_101378 [Nocardiopsis sp. L17-MgMaSL7]
MTTQDTVRPPGSPATSVTGDRATTHTGSGDVNQDATVNNVNGDQYLHQYIVGSAYSELLRSDSDGGVTYVKEHRIVAGDWLTTLRRRFVAPLDFDEIHCRNVIADHGAVVLSSSPGDGARTAALMVLAPKGEEVNRDVQDDLVRTRPDGQPVLDEATLEEGARLLVDLTGESGYPLTPLRDALEGLRVRVHRAGASLVVLVGRGDEEKLSSSLRDLVVRLGRPSPLAVLDRHLESREVPDTGTAYATQRVRTWAATATMGEIEEVARRTFTAYREAGPGETIGDWVETALEAGEAAPPEDLEAVKGRARAILLATSLMEGVPVEHLAVGVDRLLSQVSFPDDETPLLDRPGFQDELRLCGIETRAERRVYLTRAGRARMLRSAFWDAHPRLHTSFGQWVDALVADRSLSPVDRDRIAERWAEQTLRIANHREVLDRVEVWSRQRRWTAPQAAVLLTRVLRHDRYGWNGRDFIYSKAKYASLSPEFGQVLVAVCARELAATHPEQAIVRLHLLAGNGDTAVADAARSELVSLTTRRPLYLKLLVRVCDRLREHCHKPGWDHGTDRDLLWDLTPPDRLTGVLRERIGRTALEWRLKSGLGALFQRERAQTRTYAARWIGSGRRLMEVLLAASVSAGTLPSLYTSGLRWADGAATPEQRELHRADGELLVRMVDAAEGLGGRESSVAGTSTPAGTPRRENG